MHRWVNKENKNTPLMCIMDKTMFDQIRKGNPNTMKVSNNTAKIQEYKQTNDWRGICALYEPLDKVQENEEIWTNVNDLYNLAFACSKLGEPRNKMEKDKKHLQEVRKYREFSELFYRRCIEMEPYDFRYAAALGYRHYLSYMELTKPKGRRDDKAAGEMENAFIWLNKALELHPHSIKDNYRKAKLIDKQILNYRYSQSNWTRENFLELEKMESELILHFNTTISAFEKMDEELRKRYINEYVKALYGLGCFYMDKVKYWNEYACYKIAGKTVEITVTQEDRRYLQLARKLFVKCFNSEADISLKAELDTSAILSNSASWSISPVDKLYRLGLVYSQIYLLLKIQHRKESDIDQYRRMAEKFLDTAITISLKTDRRNTWHIKDKIAWLNIIAESYDKAIKTLERARDSYLLTTYAFALLLSRDSQNLARAESVLLKALNDQYSKVKGSIVPLLIYTYHAQGKKTELDQLIEHETETLAKTNCRKLLTILGMAEYESR